MTISRKKFVAFALITIALVFAGGMVALLAADLVLHHRAERSAGLNRWGYRGEVVGRRRPNEVRIAMLGGSTVFGYGVTADESIPALLEQRLNQDQPERPWRVINLGYNTEGAFAFLPNLTDFSYLDYDLVILYEGYNDLLGDLSPNNVVVRQQSPVFRATGYFPILPLWLKEKSIMLESGGLAKGYEARLDESSRPVFRPSLAARASASALQAASALTGALEHQFAAAASREQQTAGRATSTSGADCAAPWSHYCESERVAIQYSLERGKKVLVVSQPDLPSEVSRVRHHDQQQALAGMLARRFASSAHVAHVAVGNAVDLADSNVCFDRMHLNVVGNRIVAGVLAGPVAELWSRP